MLLSNYHTHCFLDDGKEKPYKYYEVAKEKGLKALGFSPHAPLPIQSNWHMKKDDMITYFKLADEIRRLDSSIEIYTGFEVDYIDAAYGPSNWTTEDTDIDYIIGSIHGFLYSDGYLCVDSTKDDLNSLIQREESFHEVGKRYYSAMRKMIERGGFDILGHFDRLMKNLPYLGVSLAEVGWYKEEVLQTLEAAARNNILFELSTTPLSRGETPGFHPAEWILPECRRLGIEFVINNDAHTPDAIAVGNGQAARVLAKAGYTSTKHLLKGVWCDYELTGKQE